MKRSGKWTAALVLMLAASGCVSPPRLLQPGSAAYQQQKAERFDPYAENDIAPAIVGARPREYDKPLAEPARARWQIRNSY